MSAMGNSDLEHDYLSTACEHGQCDECRRVCKFCPSECGHVCHDTLSGEVYYLLGHVSREQVRAVLRANMFDGEEGGMITQDASGLLDDMVEVLCGPTD